MENIGKKVLIFAYARANVGDDLFITMLVEKYKSTEFYINVENVEYEEAFKEYKNIHVINEKRNLEKINVLDYDAYVYIAGSIFMEKIVGMEKTKEFNLFVKKCKENSKPFLYISSNFGPYETQEYYNLCKDTFENSTDVCFRDKYSYNLFKENKKIRYLPDLVFSYNKKDVENHDESVGISVIDLKIRGDINISKSTYYTFLSNNIIEYIKEGKKVYLFSFCKYENDETAIQELLDVVPENFKEQINIVKYSGNLKEYINIYKSMKYMICSRFHSMVLSSIFNQKLFVVSYSLKIDNVIDDLKLTKSRIRLESVAEDFKLPLTKFTKVNKIKLFMLYIKAKKQLKVFDKIIKNKKTI